MSKKVIKLKDKRQKKINEIRTKRRKRNFLLVGILLLVLALGWFIYTSNFFQVKEIKVQGNMYLADEQVIEQSGIKRNDSLVNLASTFIRRKLNKLNWVQHTAILKDWPDTVILDIIERKPIAILESEKGSFLIDKKAFLISANNVKLNDAIPKIDGLSLKKYKTGTYIKNPVLDNALTAYKSLNPEIQKDVFSITAKSVDELYFVSQGIEIIYGKAEKAQMKNAIIKAIIKDQKESISTIDVRVPEKPVIRVLGK